VDLDGKSRAVAFVLAEPGAVPQGEADTQARADAIMAAVKHELAAFKVPARVWWLDAFPTVAAANGTKIQRNRLREMAQQRLAAE
jgi:fatty-acyl-CoA synthase